MDPVTEAIKLGTAIIARVWPDPADQAKAQSELLKLAQDGELAKLAAAKDVVVAEAGADSWLTRSWRPITMLTFVALIVARFFDLAPSRMTEAEYLMLWELVKLGLGGYVVGRTAEGIAKTVAPAIAEALKKK